MTPVVARSGASAVGAAHRRAGAHQRPGVPRPGVPRPNVPGPDVHEQGAVTVFVVGIAITLMVMAGLVVDGGNAINARQTIADDVEQAARAGASAIDTEVLRSGGIVVIDLPQARRRAIDYLTQLGYDPGGISFPTTLPQGGQQFSVSAQDVVPTDVLPLIGIRQFPVRAVATARAATGITGEVPGP
ncbi:MAG: Tad domain-containing protein [Angustibacter sp.]